MQTEIRRDELKRLIRESGFARLHDLAHQAKVSESTVRRDLIELEKAGIVRRTHGGVVYCASPPHFSSSSNPSSQSKVEIAKTAVRLIDDGDTILLDGGSTTLELARQLTNRRIQVITNSIPVAEIFGQDEHVELVLLGGAVHQRSQVALGPFTVNMLGQLHCRRAFISAAGINRDGLFNRNLLLVETERAMIHSADTVAVLADHTKFGRRSTVNLCPLSSVNEMIVNDSLDKEWQSVVAEAGIELFIASSTSETESSKRQSAQSADT